MDGGALIASVELEGPADTDPQELDELARSLQETLLDAGVEDARPATAGPAPVGTKAGEALQLGALAVAVAPGAVQGMLEAVTQWRSRRAVRTVTITIAGDSLTLDSATPDQQEQLVQAFLDRHGDRTG